MGRSPFPILVAAVLLVGCARPPLSPSLEKLRDAASARAATQAPAVAVLPGVALPAPDPVPPVAVPPDLIPFTASFAGATELMVYDDAIKDVYTLPGAGEGVEDPQLTTRGIGFGRAGEVLIYDPTTELTTHVSGLEGSRLPSFDWKGDVVTALASPATASLSTPCGPLLLYHDALIAYGDQVADLAKVEAVGALEGGLTGLRVSAGGRFLVFTSGNGQLYLMDLAIPAIAEVGGVPDGGFAFDADVSPDGAQIVLLAGALVGGGVQNARLVRYDRHSALWDPMPCANLALDASAACHPRFAEGNPSDVLFEAHVGTAPGIRVDLLDYTIPSAAVRTLATVNATDPPPPAHP